MVRRAYKPDSVPITRFPLIGGDHFSGTQVTLGFKQPTREHRSGRPFMMRQPDVHLAPHHRAPLFGFAPGDAYPATCVTTGAVGSYPTFSPLPDESELSSSAVCFLWRWCQIALPGRYPAPCPLESGLSSHDHGRKRPPGPPTPPILILEVLMRECKRGEVEKGKPTIRSFPLLNDGPCIRYDGNRNNLTIHRHV